MTKIYIYPTDTVWGIGGSINDEQIYKEISSIKNTSDKKPLSILFNSIEMVSGYFNLSTKMLDIIENLRDKSMTFGLPKSLFIGELFNEAFVETEYICIRVISSEIIDQIIADNNGPVLTTSLNLTGQFPIVDVDAAKMFWKKYASKHLFYEPQQSVSLSGKSSSIILFSGNDYSIVREGEKIDEIREYLNTIFLND